MALPPFYNVNYLSQTLLYEIMCINRTARQYFVPDEYDHRLTNTREYAKRAELLLKRTAVTPVRRRYDNRWTDYENTLRSALKEVQDLNSILDKDIREGRLTGVPEHLLHVHS